VLDLELFELFDLDLDLELRDPDLEDLLLSDVVFFLCTKYAFLKKICCSFHHYNNLMET